MEEIGLFPLGLVLLPTEQVPLHIFEPRYRELITECLDEGEPFGLVFADDDGLRRVGTLASVKALLVRGATVDSKDERHGQTALMWAAAEGHADVVQMLIEVGADYHLRLASGFTPLLFAVREGHSDVVRTLLKAGVDVNEPVPGDGQRRRAIGGRAPAPSTV